MKLNAKIDAADVQAFLSKFKKELDETHTGVMAGYLDGDTEKGGVRIADIALFNEHGTATAPARPFLTKAQKGLESRARKIMKAGLDDEIELDAIIVQLAWAAQDEIVKAIRSNIGPENSPITIHGGWIRTKSGKPFYVKGKGAGKGTLRDTGILMNSAHPGVIKDGVATVLTGK